jgi:hypothetical protein
VTVRAAGCNRVDAHGRAFGPHDDPKEAAWASRSFGSTRAFEQRDQTG